MTYPAALVLIAQGDLPLEQPPPVPAAQGLSREPNHCSVPLTPPTSPQQPCSGKHTPTITSTRIPCSVLHNDICSTRHRFSGQRLRDLHLQCPHTRQQHGARQHQPKAFWEEANLSGSPSGLEGMLSQPASARVSSTVAGLVPNVWCDCCAGSVMRLICRPHGSFCSLQIESAN